MKPILIGVAGASGSGKTELARSLQNRLGEARLLSLDSYYLDRSGWPPERREQINFDDPAALDCETLVRQVRQLSRGEAIQCPVYDFGTHCRSKNVDHIEPAPYILIEGLFALHFDDVRALCALKIYVETPDETCYQRRLERDIRERGRTAESVRDQYTKTVYPMAERYVWPTRAHADLIVSGTQPVQTSVEAVLSRLSSC